MTTHHASPLAPSSTPAAPAAPTAPAAPAAPASPTAATTRPGWERTRAVRLAVPVAQLTRSRLDAVHAHGVALSTHAALLPLRPQMVAVSPSCTESFDALPDLAAGLYYAHSLLQIRAPEARPAIALAEELTPLRAAMVGFVTSLRALKQLDSDVLEHLRGGNNYGDLVHDTGALTALLLERWPALEGRSPLTRAQVERADALANELSLASGMRPRPEDAADELQLDRDRAAFALARAYDQVRRVVTFLRWSEGDAMALVPPLNPQGTRAPTAAPAQPAGPSSPAAPAVHTAAPVAADPSVPQDSPFSG